MRKYAVAFTLAALALSSLSASETPYYRNVSEIELESGVKGCTFNKGPQRWSLFGDSGSNSNCCRCQDGTVVTSSTTTTSTASASSTSAPSTTTSSTTTAAKPTVTTPTTTTGPRVKYILDGKPVYEDGSKGPPGEEGAAAKPGEKPAA